MSQVKKRVNFNSGSIIVVNVHDAKYPSHICFVFFNKLKDE